MFEMGERIPIRVHSAVNVRRLLCRPIDQVKEITHSGGNCKGQGIQRFAGRINLKNNTINIQSLKSDFIRPVQVRYCASLRGNARNQRIVYICFPDGGTPAEVS